MKIVVPLLALLAAATPPAPRDTAVPVEQEPSHKTVLKNDYVQVFRVKLEPGTSSLMHIHAKDDAAVRFTTATVIADGPDGTSGEAERVVPGLVSARNNEAKPHVHRVRNVGTTPFDVMDVQVLRRPEGPESPALLAPAAENAKMRVYRYELAPGARSAAHTHARPYLLVAATDMDLAMTSPDGASTSHPIRAGDFHWVDVPVTHTLGNDGKDKGVIVEFELK
jgi:quercetin dioxygenase-like cupin family protein